MDDNSSEPTTHLPSKPALVGRRKMLGGAAVVGVGLAGLTACGSESATSDTAAPAGSAGGSPSSTPASSAQSSAGGSGGITVPVADVPVGGGKILAKDKVVVTQPTAGEFKAFSAVCTHQGCLVGQITGKAIVCPCHGSEFSITDGKVQNGPAETALPAKKVTKNGANLTVA